MYAKMTSFRARQTPNYVKFLSRRNGLYYAYLTSIFLTIGITYLIFNWFQSMQLIFYDEIDNWEEATFVLIKTDDDCILIKPIFEENTISQPRKLETKVRYFHIRQKKFKISDGHCTSIQDSVQSDIEGVILNADEALDPLPHEEAERLLKFYGLNEIRTRNPGTLTLLIKFISSPLTVYQLVLIIFEIIIGSYVHTSVLVLYVFIQAFITLKEQWGKIDRLNEITLHSEMIKVKRLVNGSETILEINSTQVVLGDIIFVEASSNFSVDALLLSGKCAVNESILTGESSIRTKSASSDSDKLLRAGSAVEYVNKGTIAVVVRTGWNTTKGSLLESALQKPKKWQKFEKDLLIISITLLVIVSIFNIYMIIHDIVYRGHFYARGTLNRTLEFITGCVAPSLFFIFVVSGWIVSRRLESKGIFCFESEQLRSVGRIKTICFDKTGTLTELKMKFHGVQTIDGFVSRRSLNVNHMLSSGKTDLIFALACCNSIDIVENKITGDPLEIEVMHSMGFNFVIDESENQVFVPSREFKRVSRLPHNFAFKKDKFTGFSHTSRKMSLIIETEGGKGTYLTKGAPESIVKMCDPKSLPSDIDRLIANFASKGFRMLALASKHLSSVSEENPDANLNFLGLIVLVNELKSDSRQTIDELTTNRINVNLVSGDHLLTCVSLAKEANIILDRDQILTLKSSESDTLEWTQLSSYPLSKNKILTEYFQSSSAVLSHCQQHNVALAIEGDAIEKLFSEVGPNIFEFVKVVGRASPHQKQIFVKILQESNMAKNFTVGFVGDGANDSLAVNTADMGLVIGNGDVTLVSSYSTRASSIAPVLQLLINGKFSLETSIQTQSFCLYAGMIANLNLIFLYAIGLSLSNFDNIIALFYWLPPCVLIAFTESSDRLNPHYPSAGLLSSKRIGELFLQISAMFSCLLIFHNYLTHRMSHKPTHSIIKKDDRREINIDFFIESKAAFIFVSFNLVVMLIAFHRGFPFKRSSYTNFWLMLYLIGGLTLLTLLLFIDMIQNLKFVEFLIAYLTIPSIEKQFRVKIIAIIIVVNLGLFFLQKTIQKASIIDNQVKYMSLHCDMDNKDLETVFEINHGE